MYVHIRTALLDDNLLDVGGVLSPTGRGEEGER